MNGLMNPLFEAMLELDIAMSRLDFTLGLLDHWFDRRHSPRPADGTGTNGADNLDSSRDSSARFKNQSVTKRIPVEGPTLHAGCHPDFTLNLPQPVHIRKVRNMTKHANKRRFEI